MLVMSSKKRAESQLKAERKYDQKRASKPRFGGRCSEDEKELLVEMTVENDMTEKDLIFTALRFYRENNPAPNHPGVAGGDKCRPNMGLSKED